MVYTVVNRFANSSSSAFVVAVTVNSSMLIATNVAEDGFILGKRQVSASDR